jgi:NADPH:quinone reductase-like Zn-dependent oxidoreductase
MNAVQELQRFLESGAFKPVIDRVYPLDQIVEAYEYAESGQKIGNVLIGVASTS